MTFQTGTALVVIAKNEQRCIARCLESATQYVDRIVVLDTGSTDETVSIAKRCGAAVHHASWKNDFSYARNLALDIANSEFNLIMDADEWIISVDKTLNFHNLNPRELGLVSILSEGESGREKQIQNSWITRLLPHGIRYRGKVHEQAISNLPRIRLPITIGHDGYTPEIMNQKKGRNLQLLNEALAENPNDPYTLYSIGKEHEYNGRNGEACESYEKAISLLNINTPFRLDLDYRFLCTLLELGRLEDALMYSSEIMEKYEHVTDYFFILGYIFLEGAKNDSENARSYWLPRAEQSWKRCLEIGEQPDISESVIGRGSFLAARNLSVLFELTGDKLQADHYRSMQHSYNMLNRD